MAKTKSKGKFAPAPGNEFSYYVPKPATLTASAGTGSAAAASTATSPGKPLPTSRPKAGVAKGAYLTPKNFIETNFVLTSNAGFGTKAALGGTHHVLRRVDVVRAALEGGYGRRSNWSSAFVLNKAEALDLARYLVQRLHMVVVCINLDKNMAQHLRSFYGRVEASEKTAISFILGGIGAYLAAQKWLAAGGDRIRSFLHVGIFTRGIAGATAAVAFNTRSKKVPDYLVEGDSGAWHVFESKGGHLSGRWARLCQGLAQLANVPQIGWAGNGTTYAMTCVCVHTSVDPGGVLRVTAVDPPSDGDGADGEQSLVLVAGVCRLLQMLETIDQYRALAEGLPEEGLLLRDSSWQLATSSMFGNLLVGVPGRYLQREDEVRERLAVFFAICEVLDDMNSPGKAAVNFVESVTARVNQVASIGMQVQGWAFELSDLVEKLAPNVHTPDFLFRCSKDLMLEELAAELMPPNLQDEDRLLLSLRQSGEFAITSGGMFLRLMAEMASNGEG